MSFRDRLSLVSNASQATGNEVDISSTAYQSLRKSMHRILLERIDLERLQQLNVEQFKREMQVIAGLRHPNIVRFLDSGSDQGTFFFVMEYCDVELYL